LKARCDILADSIQQTVTYVTQLANTYATQLNENLAKSDEIKELADRLAANESD
jgi:glycine betaine/choline ABC-type transport system substrate-binding protein